MGAIEEALWPIFLLSKYFGVYPEGRVAYKIYSFTILLCNTAVAVIFVVIYLTKISADLKTSITDISSTLFFAFAFFRHLGSVYFLVYNRDNFKKLLKSVNCVIELLQCSEELKVKLHRRQFCLIALFGLLLMCSLFNELITYSFDEILDSLNYSSYYVTFGMVIANDLMFSTFAMTTRIMFEKINNILQVNHKKA